jgi:hypothetical protein
MFMISKKYLEKGNKGGYERKVDMRAGKEKDRESGEG